MYYKALFLSLVLVTGFTACSDGNSTSSGQVVNEQPVVSKADALTIATKMVERKKEGSWLSAKNYKIIDVRDINDNIKAYEVSVFDKDNHPLGYLNVPAFEGHGIISSFNYEGIANSAMLEKKYHDVWLSQLEQDNVTVVNKKFVGGVDGIFALAIKTDKPAQNIESPEGAKKIGDYYIFTAYPVSDLAYAIGFTNQSKQPNLGESSSVDSKEIERSLTEERETRKRLLSD